MYLCVSVIKLCVNVVSTCRTLELGCSGFTTSCRPDVYRTRPESGAHATEYTGVPVRNTQNELTHSKKCCFSYSD